MIYDYDILWGGFYTHLNDDGVTYSVVRLLDFDKDAMHLALYSEDFEKIPTIEEVKGLSPFIQHTPFEMLSILNYKEFSLLGACPLDEQGLNGYRTYLETLEAPEEYIEETFNSIMVYSTQPPLKIRFEEVEDGIELSIRAE